MPSPLDHRPSPAGDGRALDELDRQILRCLQRNGRITNAELAKQVRLSPSPCLRRVKQLEASGHVTGYTATLDRELLGRGLTVVVLVSLVSQRQEVLEAFEAAVDGIEDVLTCLLIAGEADYLLTIAVRDLAAYQELYTGRLGELPGVASMKSLVTMKAVKDSAVLPV